MRFEGSVFVAGLAGTVVKIVGAAEDALRS